MGIEPTQPAWKAGALPLSYTRITFNLLCRGRDSSHLIKLVEGGGFEPPKAEPADLQSAPFGHSGTPPRASRVLSSLDYTLSTGNRPESLKFPAVRDMFQAWNREKSAKGEIGADRGTRTPNLLITNQLHYQLCYVGVSRSRIVVHPSGEQNSQPATHARSVCPTALYCLRIFSRTSGSKV